MKEKFIEGKTYKLPGALTPFQEEMYVHLINWKWGKNIKEPGIYQKKDKRGIVQTYEYDAILPKSVHKNYPFISHNFKGLTGTQKKILFQVSSTFQSYGKLAGRKC